MTKVSLNIDLRWVCLFLLAVIGGMLFFWKPWNTKVDTSRTISVNGEATIEKVPDEYTFSPSFSATSVSSKESVQTVSNKGNAAVGKLKELGVAEDQIATSVNSYPEYNYLDGASRPQTSGYTATYQITVKVGDKDLAQKITDYLATTDAGGSITPYAQFKDETRKTIENELREKAISDARSKAETQAKQLNVKLGKVVSLTENPGYGIYPGFEAALDVKDSTAQSPVLLTGKQAVTLSVTVVFQIK